MARTTGSRSYNAPLRRARAEATREAILVAARRLFVAEGVAGTTVATVARHAGVSTQTVYALFQSKAGVLLALLDDLERSVDATAYLEAIEAAASPHDQLRAIVGFHSALFDRGLDVVDMVRRTSSHPEVRPVWEAGQRRRRAACEHWARRWENDGALRRGIGPATAADLLWLHCGDDVYASLVIGCGWRRRRVEQWLVRILDAALFAREPARPSPSPASSVGAPR